jgi:voltage-gated potassium channel Kch
MCSYMCLCMQQAVVLTRLRYEVSLLLQAARIAGFNVTYGDGSRASVIKAFGVQDVRAFVVVYTARRRSVAAVDNLRAAFPDTPIWARALDLRCCTAAQLLLAGVPRLGR